VDAGGKIRMFDNLESYRQSVGESTWIAVNKFADELRGKGTKIGFFSSTPQGGGVALVRSLPYRAFDGFPASGACRNLHTPH